MMPWLNRNLWLVVLILAVIGLADASYLTWQHYANTIPPCTIHGCETVLTSKYATIGPIPIAAGGMAYYLIVAFLALVSRTQARWRKWLLVVVTLGMAATLVLVYLQGFVIKAWCQYCLLSAGITTVLFVTVMAWRPGRVQPAPSSSNTPKTSTL